MKKEGKLETLGVVHVGEDICIIYIIDITYVIICNVYNIYNTYIYNLFVYI